MNKITVSIIFVLLGILSGGDFLILPAQSRQIKDSRGNEVTVPDNIRKVYAGSPPATFMLYALDPGLISGLNFPIAEQDKPYLRSMMHSLPVLGGFFGQGEAANTEVILKANPDLILLWSQRNSILKNQNEEILMKKIPIPHVYVFFESIYDYGNAFLFMGKLFNREQRARLLAQYAGETLAEVDRIAASIPAGRRPRVYYAEGSDGLNTECDESWHAELINIAGARNVHQCKSIDSFGMVRLSMEQVMIYNPEVILVHEKPFYNKIYSDPLWKDIRAVKSKRVYLIPRIPFSWFDRPPSFMRLLGIKWLMNNLYPSDYKINIVKEAKYFYRLFLGVDKTEEEIRKVIYP
ncbi:MAG: ABC transporter substrate-binding protein [Spirochaetes bacterium]|nr:ABC transporter substrate-binding protein [Spirochaetota bacterium]